MSDKLKNLVNKQDLEIPESFEKKFEETLNSLPNKKVHKKNKYTMAASLALIIMVSSGVAMAISNNKYKYLPTSGVVFDSESSMYGHEEPIIGVDSNGEKIQLEMFISEEMNRAVVDIGGEFNIPKSTKAELKIGNKVYKNERSDLSELKYTWGAVDVFDEIGEYKESDKITYSIYMDDSDKVDFNIKLKEIDGVSKYEELGITSNYNNIPITAILNEKKDYMEVDFILKQTQIGLDISPGYDSGDGTFSGIYLLDANETRVNGLREIKNGDIKFNRVKFDTRNLVKPYKIIIPEVRASLFWEVRTTMSDEITLPIPKDGETLEINKIIEMDKGENFVKTDNDSVKLVRGTREKDKYIVELEYNENKKGKDNIRQVVAFKDNRLKKDEFILSQTGFDEDMNFIQILEFDINGFNNTIKFKLSPSYYELRGNWEFSVK